MKYQNQNHLQKQLTALSHQLFSQKKKKPTTDIQLGSEYASKIVKCEKQSKPNSDDDF